MLSTNIKKLLETHGMTSSQLAKKSDMPKPIISRIAAGKTKNPLIETLKPLAQAFGVSIDQLIGVSPLPSEFKHGLVIPVKRLLVPLIDWKNISYWEEIKNNFIPKFTIEVDSNLSSSSFALKIKNNDFEPRIGNGTVIIVDPLAKPKKNRDYVIIEKVGKDEKYEKDAKNEKNEKVVEDVYSNFTIKQFLAEENKKLLKNVGANFAITPLKNKPILGVISEAFIDLKI